MIVKPIPRIQSLSNDKDYNFLKSTGLEYIEKLAGKIWTDYNEHDSGITSLEMLSYAITDLAHRIELPMPQLLSSEKSNQSAMQRQFPSAIKVLPSKAITALDYRALFLHVKGVRNA